MNARIIAAALTTFAIPCIAADLSGVEEYFVEESSFAVVTQFFQVPEPVRDFLCPYPQQMRKCIADPGEPYSGSDVIVSTEPKAQLVFALVGEKSVAVLLRVFMETQLLYLFDLAMPETNCTYADSDSSIKILEDVKKHILSPVKRVCVEKEVQPNNSLQAAAPGSVIFNSSVSLWRAQNPE